MAESKQQQSIKVGSFVRYTPEMAKRLGFTPKQQRAIVGKVLSVEKPLEPFTGSPRVVTVRFVMPKGSLTDVQVLTCNIDPVRVAEGVAE